MKCGQNISDDQLEQLQLSLSEFGLFAERLSQKIIKIRPCSGDLILEKTKKDAMLAYRNKKISLYEKNLDLLIKRNEGEHKIKWLFVVIK